MSFKDIEIPTEDGSTPMKLVFIPDYLKSNELTRCTLRITPWHDYVFNVIQKELRNTCNQHGITFIRRRMIKYGLGLLEKDNEKAISIIQIKYDKFLKTYDYESYRKFHQNGSSIGDCDFLKKVEIRMEEDDFGRVDDLSKTLHVQQSIIMRISLAYVIQMLDCFGENVLLEAISDIEQFKKYLKEEAL